MKNALLKGTFTKQDLSHFKRCSIPCVLFQLNSPTTFNVFLGVDPEGGIANMVDYILVRSTFHICLKIQQTHFN